MSEISAGFFLHNIGKYTIPEYITRGKESLTDGKWEIIIKLPEKGYELPK